MSTSEDLDQLSDGQLGSFRYGFDDTLPWDLIAAILLMDDGAGVTQPNDFIVLHPTFAGYVFLAGTVVSEGLESFSEMFNAEGDANNEALASMRVRMTEETFRFKFNDWKVLHESIRGKEFLMRLMTNDQAKQVAFECATVRADGSVITLPEGRLRF